MMSFAVIVVAAGSGTRFGGNTAKQFLPLGGKPLVQHSLELFLGQTACAELILVVPPTGVAVPLPAFLLNHPLVRMVKGGSSRQESVRHGLEALTAKTEYVLIHDAARPLLTEKALNTLLAALPGKDGAILGHGVVDTLKHTTTSGDILTTLERSVLWAAETPQAFRTDAIKKAHAQFADLNVSDDSALAELSGLNIIMVENPDANMKITHPGDLALAEAILATRGGSNAEGFRVGYGVDIHPFTAGDAVTLGGVRIPHTHALKGHSDADAVLHALTDALLGAMGEADIGVHFPPNDTTWRGAASRIFVDKAMQLLRARGGSVVNVDLTIISEAPKIAPHREAIRQNIAGLLGIAVDAVAIKATTAEKLGWIGRGEGLYASAAVLVRL
jgi:2-C-methyl-D-erythritol 4-phosphate cytidylyltransferase/2-C-methyl-D-erythritol 2,4-cyclodiphosphate synthase